MNWDEIAALDRRARSHGYASFLDCARAVVGKAWAEMCRHDIDRVIDHLEGLDPIDTAQVVETGGVL